MMIIIMIVYEYIHPCSLYHDSWNHDTDCMGVKKKKKINVKQFSNSLATHSVLCLMRSLRHDYTTVATNSKLTATDLILMMFVYL